MFVMIGAIGVHFFAYRIMNKRDQPILSSESFVPTTAAIDRRLVFGAIIFGFGWGIGGYCPGPALVSLVDANRAVVAFVASMIAGMSMHKFLFERSK